MIAVLFVVLVIQEVAALLVLLNTQRIKLRSRNVALEPKRSKRLKRNSALTERVWISDRRLVLSVLVEAELYAEQLVKSKDAEHLSFF